MQESEVGVIIRGKQKYDPLPSEIDLYGNFQLHHAVSHDNPDINRLKELLEKFPLAAEKPNQFGRLPLHYVVDRPNASLPAVKLLLAAFPGGATFEDNEYNTPYDLAVHWRLSKRFLRAILKYDKQQDLEMWRRLEYGYLYAVLACCCCWFRAPRKGDESSLIFQDSDDSFSKGQVHKIL